MRFRVYILYRVHIELLNKVYFGPVQGSYEVYVSSIWELYSFFCP